MRKIFVFLSLIGLMITINEKRTFAASDFEIPVKVIEIKDLGLSDRDESKSVIEVRWQTSRLEQAEISLFRLTFTAVYADGSRITEKRTVEKHKISARVEIPSVKTLPGRPPAFIKEMKATVKAVISEK